VNQPPQPPQKLGDYKQWCQTVDAFFKSRRPDVRVAQIDRNFLWECFTKGMAPLEFVMQPNLKFDAAAPQNPFKAGLQQGLAGPVAAGQVSSPAPPQPAPATTSPATAPPNPLAEAEKNKNAAKGCLGCLGLLILVGIFGKSCGINGNDDFDAYFYSTEFVKKRLKAPSTADFANRSECTVVKVGDHRYRVSGYVDSQNGFGAMIRSSWVTEVHSEGDSWYLDEIGID
jgi:hypothetical protein